MKKPRGRTYGLYARNFERPVQPFVDQDYAARLSPADRQWLSDFNDAYYGGDFRGVDAAAWSLEQRRAVYTTKNAARADAYAQPLTYAVVGTAEARAPAEPPDLADAPDYLATDEYRSALAYYRSLLTPGRMHRKPTTPEAKRAWAVARLERSKRTK